MDATPAAATAPVKAWRCTVCGHIHTGSGPPDACPVCGAGPDLFEPFDEGAEQPAPQSTRRVVIVGAGIAGLTAAEAARRAAPASEITLVSGEDGLPYYRLNLTRYLAGEAAAQTLPLRAPAWFDEQRVTLRHGAVTRIDRPGRAVVFADSTTLGYDALVLATGAAPFVPPIAGAALPGVHTLRTKDDADRLIAAVSPGAPCVCVGGGLLGLETAGALARRGLRVEVLEGAPWLLPRQLARPTAELLQQHLAAAGLRARCGVRVTAITAAGAGLEVALADGERVPAALVVIAAGVRPDARLAREAGLAVRAGVVVDARMATADPAVFAAGDNAEHAGVTFGIWPVAFAQGRVAGTNAAGGAREYTPVAPSNRLKVVDVDVVSIGQVEPAGPEDRVIEHREGGAYLRFVCRGETLVGANLYGDASLASVVQRAIDEHQPLAGVAAITARVQLAAAPAAARPNP
jgi:nitrite reductase (NADH) large subunit